MRARSSWTARAFSPGIPSTPVVAGSPLIYQELNLAPHLSVEENIVLGEEPSRAGWVNRTRRRELARSVLAELRHEGIPLDAPVYTRSVAEQQIIEIARALVGKPKVIIMDEPTSSLSQVDTENLFAVIGRLRARGVSVVYISHFLEECQRIRDRYTVLRDGESVGHGAMAPMAQASLTEIIRLMVGREIKEIYPRLPHALGEPVLAHVARRFRAGPRRRRFRAGRRTRKHPRPPRDEAGPGHWAAERKPEGGGAVAEP
jgi:ABC-type sugar transport system ATPase subunit